MRMFMTGNLKRMALQIAHDVMVLMDGQRTISTIAELLSHWKVDMRKSTVMPVTKKSFRRG